MTTSGSLQLPFLQFYQLQTMLLTFALLQRPRTDLIQPLPSLTPVCTSELPRQSEKLHKMFFTFRRIGWLVLVEGGLDVAERGRWTALLQHPNSIAELVSKLQGAQHAMLSHGAQWAKSKPLPSSQPQPLPNPHPNLPSTRLSPRDPLSSP